MTDELPVSLESALDMVKVREQLDRHLKQRGSDMHRVRKLALHGPARERSKAEDSFNHRPMPSDPPAIQLALMLAEELESGDWRKIEDDFKRCQIRNGLYKQLTDIIASLDDNASVTFKEYCQLIDQHMRQSEHADKMAMASGKKDEDSSDAELTAKAKRLGIPLNGDPDV